jgi:hypothetical protein
MTMYKLKKPVISETDKKSMHVIGAEMQNYHASIKASFTPSCNDINYFHGKQQALFKDD